jgi:hypothetical protein
LEIVAGCEGGVNAVEFDRRRIEKIAAIDADARTHDSRAGNKTADHRLKIKWDGRIGGACRSGHGNFAAARARWCSGGDAVVVDDGKSRGRAVETDVGGIGEIETVDRDAGPRRAIGRYKVGDDRRHKEIGNGGDGSIGGADGNRSAGGRARNCGDNLGGGRRADDARCGAVVETNDRAGSQVEAGDGDVGSGVSDERRKPGDGRQDKEVADGGELAAGRNDIEEAGACARRNGDVELGVADVGKGCGRKAVEINGSCSDEVFANDDDVGSGSPIGRRETGDGW